MSNLLKNKTFYLTWPDGGVELLFHKLGCDKTDNKWTADMVVFPGGADISPILYGEKALPYTTCNISRDIQEIGVVKELFDEALKVGICRGAQLLNVISGGSLWQDVDGHGEDHDLIDAHTGEVRTTTSTHHQMMLPGCQGIILAEASQSTYKKSFNISLDEIDIKGKPNDLEAVYYQGTNSLCFQGHPEYGNKDCLDYFLSLLDKQLSNKLEEFYA